MESKFTITLESIKLFIFIYFVGSILIGFFRPRFFAITVGCLFEYLRLFPNFYAAIMDLIKLNIKFETLCFIWYIIIMVLFIESASCAFYFYLAYANDRSTNFHIIISFFLFGGGIAAISPVAKMKSFSVNLDYILDLIVAIFIVIYFIRNSTKIITYINQFK